jgi:hypothetical protein
MRGPCEERAKTRGGSDPRKSDELSQHGSDEDTEGWDGGGSAGQLCWSQEGSRVAGHDCGGRV